MFFRKQYKIDMNSADQTLQNIFAACNVEPNTIPFDKLILREHKRLMPYNICLAITILILLITLSTPLIFIPFSNTNGKLHIITLEQHHIEDGILYIKVKPCHGSIDLNNSYMLTCTGEKIAVLSYDSENHILAFPYLNEECNIYILGENNSTLHLLYTPLP